MEPKIRFKQQSIFRGQGGFNTNCTKEAFLPVNTIDEAIDVTRYMYLEQTITGGGRPIKFEQIGETIKNEDCALMLLYNKDERLSLAITITRLGKFFGENGGEEQ